MTQALQPGATVITERGRSSWCRGNAPSSRMACHSLRRNHRYEMDCRLFQAGLAPGWHTESLRSAPVWARVLVQERARALPPRPAGARCGAEPPSRRCPQDRRSALSKAGDHRPGPERAPNRQSRADRHEPPLEPPARAACAPPSIGSHPNAPLPAPPSPRICNAGCWCRHDRNAAADWSGKYSHPATNRMCRKPDCHRQRRPEAGSQGGVAAGT